MKSFFELIDRLNACREAEREELERQVWSRYGVEQAVMALDMSEFSLSVRRSGILSYLGLIRRMQVTTRPIVERCGGAVVKYQADNLMAVFARVHDAVTAAVEINRAMPVVPGVVPVSIGIDHGRFLMVPRKDCFGDTVNVAYKLGEDVARPGEVLLSAGARGQLGAESVWPLHAQEVSLSGLTLSVFSVDYRGEAPDR